jgi:multiple sugar transport system substrate-binding protein
MTNQTRREFLKSAGVVTAASMLGVGNNVFAATSGGVDFVNKPESGAELEVLRWTRFVQGEADQWMANVKKFTKKTGVKVTVNRAGFEDIRPKAAVSARANSGPDIILGWFDDPHKFPDKLVDVSDVANYLGKKYGGWFDVCKKYGMQNDRWIGLPIANVGNNMLYLKSKVKAVGFDPDNFPTDFDKYLKLCQALHANGTPPGFALGHSVLDADDWTFWVLWGHGGKVADKDGNIVLNSPETVDALKYVRELYKTYIPGTLSWLDPSNNNAFFNHQIAMTANGISIYYSALNADNPEKHAMADDIKTAAMPVGPVGRPTELHGITQMMLFKYSKYPKAAKALMQFMMEADQYNAWLKKSLGYVSHTLKAYDKNPIWTSDPNITPYRDVTKRTLADGYAGPLGNASSSAMSEYIIVDMMAEAASGRSSPKTAASKAADRAKRLYNV